MAHIFDEHRLARLACIRGVGVFSAMFSQITETDRLTCSVLSFCGWLFLAVAQYGQGVWVGKSLKNRISKLGICQALARCRFHRGTYKVLARGKDDAGQRCRGIRKASLRTSQAPMIVIMRMGRIESRDLVLCEQSIAPLTT